jgi:phosphoesterase RecJ-like protein
MKAIDLAGVVAELRRAKSALVTTHVSPDGDAIGSMLAVRYLLEALGCNKVVCACDDPVPRVYRWLSGADTVRSADGVEGTFDLVVIVDVSRRDRIGRVSDRIGAGQRVLVIDHHLDDAPCGDVNFVDPSYAAIGELVAELFEVADVPMSKEAAECAYVALATDTGSFRFSSTAARSHRMAARMLEAGINVAEISSRIFDAMSLAKFRLLARVLGRVQFSCDGRVAYSEVAARELQELSASGEDLDGLINFVRNIEGVEVAMLFKETGPATTKVSLRSRINVNSALFLQRFGGGGHSGAAGATIALPLQQARERVLEEAGCLLGEKV